MELILMHKDVKVMKFSLNEKCNIQSIIEIYDVNHMPYIAREATNNKLFTLTEWWNDRSVPLSREGYHEAMNELGLDNSLALVIKARGLSLTDQYWLKSEEEDIRYDDVSFFSNDFSNDVGEIFIGNKIKGKISFFSPESTSNGNLRKKWVNIKGKKYLLKSGTSPHRYEVFNEVIASRVMDILGIDHVSYELAFYGGIYCRSLDFISYNEDFVSAYQIIKSVDKRNDVSLYNHLLNIVSYLGISDYQKTLDQMLLVDYLLGNTDRHLNNFGLIRDAKSLAFTRAAPIFDTGSCLGYNLSDEELSSLNHVEWMPFSSQKHHDQLSLISDYSWIDVDGLKSIPFQIDQLLIKYDDYISITRRKAILAFLTRRVNRILRVMGIDEEVSLSFINLTLLEEDILYFVKTHNNKLVDLNKMADEYGVAYITIYRAVSSLTDKGLLERIGSRKKGYWILQ